MYNCILICSYLLDNEINPEEIGIITWTENDESLESKKPFMAVYLKSNTGGNQFLSPPVKKLTRKRRKENIENRSNKSNPFKCKIFKVLYFFVKAHNYLNNIF